MFLRKDVHSSLSLSVLVLIFFPWFFLGSPHLGVLFHYILLSLLHPNCEFYSSGHFLINAADKVVASHLMRRQYVNFHWKLLSPTLTFSLNTIFSIRTSRRYFVSSPPILGWIPYSGLECLYCDSHNLLFPSSVLGSPHYYHDYKIFLQAWCKQSQLISGTLHVHSLYLKKKKKKILCMPQAYATLTGI